MEFGLVLSQFSDRWDHTRSDAVLADTLGLDSVWLADHLENIERPSAGVFEAWTGLSAVAGFTETVRLGHLVNCASFRNPGLLAKMACTLDHASAGRLELGLGAGWHQREYEAFGYEYPTRRDRRKYFEEYVEVLRLLFTGGPVTYKGDYLTLDDAYCRPLPVQQPHPPIVIGTGGKLMSRFAGRVANTWNCPAQLLTDFEEARALMLEGAGNRRVRTTIQIPVAVGRTAQEAQVALEIGREHMAWMGDTMAIGITGTVDEALEQVAAYRERGVDGLMAVLPGTRNRPAFIEAYAELAARF